MKKPTDCVSSEGKGKRRATDYVDESVVRKLKTDILDAVKGLEINEKSGHQREGKETREASDQIGDVGVEKWKEAATDRSIPTDCVMQEVVPVDIISELPDNVIYHILSFLRCKKDSARTSILSKRWRELWISSSVLDFDQRKFFKREKRLCMSNEYHETRGRRLVETIKKNDMFKKIVDTTLQNRVSQKSIVQKFKLRLCSYFPQFDHHMNRWLDFISGSSIDELDIHVPVGKKEKNSRYYLPPSLLTIKTLTALRISGCDLGNCYDIKLPRLRKLCLGQLSVTEETFQHLMVSCPLIEDLRLIRCSGLSVLFLSSSKLVRVDLHQCKGLQSVALQAPNLETFWFQQKTHNKCILDLKSCSALKYLTLEGYNLGDHRDLASFPALEYLSLSKCSSSECVGILNNHLKTLILTDCEGLKEVDIDAPNLCSLEYKGYQMPFSSMNPSSLMEAKFYFRPRSDICCVGLMSKKKDSLWFPQLQQFLGKFDHSRGLKLAVFYEKDILIHEDMRNILIPNADNVKLQLFKSSFKWEDLLEDILRACHPETLSIVSSTTSSLAEQMYEHFAIRDEEPKCCKYNQISLKCWRHCLKDMRVLCPGIGRKNKEPDEWSTWLRSSVPSVEHLVCFQLDWHNWHCYKQG